MSWLTYFGIVRGSRSAGDEDVAKAGVKKVAMTRVVRMNRVVVEAMIFSFIFNIHFGRSMVTKNGN